MRTHLSSCLRSQRYLRVMARIVLWLALVMGFCASPHLAEAAQPPERIAVKIEGPTAKAVRSVVLGALPPNVTVVEEIAYAGALARAGLPGGKMAHALTDAKMKPKLLTIAGRAVKGANLDGALLGRVRGAGGGLELAMVFVGEDGSPAVDTTVSLGGPEAEQQDRLREALSPVFPTAAPARDSSGADTLGPAGSGAGADDLAGEATPEQAPSEPTEDDAEGDSASRYVPNRPGSSILGIGASFALAGRYFSYREPAAGSTNLWPYEAFSAPAIHATLELYPAASTDVTFVKDLGITAAYSHILGWTSHTEDDTASFSTRWQQLWAGLRYRIRTAEPDEHPGIIGISGRFGWNAFVLSPDDAGAETLAGEVPSVEYLLLGGHLDGRIPVGDHFALLPAVGGYGVIDGGELFDRFASASFFGLDASLDVAVVLDLGFELRAGAEYTGLFSWLEPDAASTFVASGADDHFIAVRLGVGYVY